MPLKTNRRSFLKTISAAAGSMLLSTFACHAPKNTKPNILLVMSDDLGWKDLSCFGNDRVQTPNIDRLAENGIKLTQYYSASAVCTPTRASVLTGKYPLRFDIRQHFTDMGEYLPTGDTLPKILKSAGYQTAHVGKWHLGGVRVKDCQMRDKVPGPHQHGFDHYLTQIEEQPLRGKLGRDRQLYRKGGTCLLRNDLVVTQDDPYFDMHFTDINGEETVRLIKAFSKKEQPFFINLWWLTPHTPYEPTPEPHWSQTAEEGISDDQHRFRSMVARMDYQFGKILHTLEKTGCSENTLIVFVSDNGGAYEANIGELKGGKTDLHEGGIRVPALVSWPGHIQPKTETNELCHSNDLLPTLAAAAGATVPNVNQLDGGDLLPFLIGALDYPTRGPVFWQIDLYKHLERHYPKPEPYATEIARLGNWKMLAYKGEPVELYNVEADLYEQKNVLDEHSEIVNVLTQALKKWLDEPRQPFGKVE